MSVSAAQAEAFYAEVGANHEVWSIRDEGGCPAPKNGDGVRAMPFWSKQSRAQRIIDSVPAYKGFEPFAIPLTEWQEKWLADLERDGLHAGLNWSGTRAAGYDVAIGDLRRNLAARGALSSERRGLMSRFRRGR